MASYRHRDPNPEHSNAAPAPGCLITSIRRFSARSIHEKLTDERDPTFVRAVKTIRVGGEFMTPKQTRALALRGAALALVEDMARG